jgi:hypothetical protein
MRNRAKCSLCKDIIESFYLADYAQCSCGEIGIRGGNMRFETFAKDFAHFKRFDDHDNEIEVRVIDDDVKPFDKSTKITKEEVVLAVKEMIDNYQNLPPHALSTEVTGYDLLSVLFLLHAFLSIED